MEKAQLSRIAQLNHTDGDERLDLSAEVWKGVNEELEKEMETETTTMYVCGEVQAASLGWSGGQSAAGNQGAPSKRGSPRGGHTSKRAWPKEGRRTP